MSEPRVDEWGRPLPGPLTISEVDQWPPLGPMNLDPQRVRDVLLELEGQRERAEKAEAQLASITGVTRLELVAAERAKRDGLLAVLKDAREELRLLREKDDCGPYDPTLRGRIDIAIAAAEAAP